MRRTELPYLRRWNGDAVMHEDMLFYPPYKFGYAVEEYEERLLKSKKDLPIEALPQQINPYALGHFINHPPPDTPPNVCLIDFEVPESFFPSYFLKHFPYMRHSVNPSEEPKSIHTIGIIALQPLQNQELFVNYGTERFLEHFTPKWLHDPPDNLPISNYLCKEDCLHQFSKLTRLLLKWDKFSLTEIEKMQRDMEEDRKRRTKEAMEDPNLFAKYYKK